MEKLLHRRITGLLPVLTVWAAVALSACYHPNILNGGLRCSEGGLCPEGFTCHQQTGLCYRPDTAPSDVNCSPMCADQPAAGQTCSPACQNGCSCGQRCSVVVSEGKSHCVPVGSKALGQLCTPGNAAVIDDCAAGLICLAESATCGVGVHRCYRLCVGDEQCNKQSEDVHCSIAVLNGLVDTGFRTCDVPHQDCDPVAKTGCPTGFTCFVLSNGQTLCDCPTNSQAVKPTDKPGPGMEGAPCVLYSDCGAGLTCVIFANGDGGQSGACRPVCMPGKTTCSAGMMCKAIGGAKFGACTP